LPRIHDLFGDGSHIGLRLVYKEQAQPNGIARRSSSGRLRRRLAVCLILGDNIFYGTT